MLMAVSQARETRADVTFGRHSTTPVWETEWFSVDFERGVVSSYFSFMYSESYIPQGKMTSRWRS